MRRLGPSLEVQADCAQSLERVGAEQSQQFSVGGQPVCPPVGSVEHWNWIGRWPYYCKEIKGVRGLAVGRGVEIGSWVA